MNWARPVALGGVIGPVAFISAWVVGGATTAVDYSPVDDAISRLAAVGADSRPLMTTGFIVFGVSVVAFATALRRTPATGHAWISVGLTGLATLAVAATPLDRSDTVDSLHGLAASLGYVALAASPLLAAGPLHRAGHRRLAGAGAVASVISAVSLVSSALVDANGLFQRIGLTSVDLWLIALAVLVVSRRTPTSPE